MQTDIVAMRRVTAYRTSDGELHDHRPDAQKHQARLDLIQIVTDESLLNSEAAADLIDAALRRAPEIIKLLRAASRED